MKKKICSLLFCLFCCIGAYAQITTSNYSQYIGQDILFDEQKPWYKGYSIGSFVFSGYKIKNGVMIKDIQLINKGTIMEFTLQNKTTGKEIKFREWIDDGQEIKLSYVSISTNLISEKRKIEEVLLLDNEKIIDQQISNHISTHGFDEEDKYLQTLVERKRSFIEKKESEKEATDTGISEGDDFLYLMLGGGFSTGKIEGVKWGKDGGISYGFQTISFLTPQFGLGLEFNGTDFAKISESSNYAGYHVRESLKANTNNILLIGRFNVNPKENVRVYIPFGLGVGRTRFSYDVGVSGYIAKEKDRSTDFACFLGLGLESKMEENAFFALEARLNQQDISLEDFGIESQARYINVLAKIGWKF